MGTRSRLTALGLLGVIAFTAYSLRLQDYWRYGLDAAHIDEIDPFRVRHGAKLAVPSEELVFGAHKDRIPALTNPAFVSAAEAPAWLTDTARVIGVEHNGVAKAYPTLLLLWHEAVNDTVGGKPYLVTY